MRKIFQSRERRRASTTKLVYMLDDIYSELWKLSLGGHLMGGKYRMVAKLLLDLHKQIHVMTTQARKEKQNRIQSRLQKLLTKRVK